MNPGGFTEIARIHEHPHGGTAGIVMIGIGGIVMLLALVVGGSINIVATATVWTGWNVLSGLVWFAGLSRTYIVCRPTETAPLPIGYEGIYAGFPYLRLGNGKVRVLTSSGPYEFKNWRAFYKMANHEP